MKKLKKFLLCFIFAIIMIFSMVGCSSSFTNPGDSLGGGGTASTTPSSTSTLTLEDNIKSVVSARTFTTEQKTETLPTDYTTITSSTEITTSGNYLVGGTITGNIKVSASNVHLYLKDANITNTSKKVISSSYDLIITLVSGSTNTITNADGSSDEGKNAIDVEGNLTINCTGNLTVLSQKNAIKCNNALTILNSDISVSSATSHGFKADNMYISNATLTVTSVFSDGLHAESDYDSVTTAPTFSLDVGYVYILDSTVTITSTSDGIQADSFVYIDGGNYTINAGGGAPSSANSSTSDAGTGKGIKAGLIDYEINSTSYDLESGDYTILVDGGTFNISSSDDALHSNSEMIINDGTFTLNTGDDGMHSDDILKVNDGSVTVAKSYEGIESAKIEIAGGNINVKSADDGINAADGTNSNSMASNSNCYMIFSGGTTIVDASGDGIDSNGTILISGGNVYINGPTANDNGSLDSNGGILVNGGNLFAVGSLGMVETPASNSSQYVISFASSSNISAGTNLSLTDSSGNTILSFTTTKTCRSIIISSSKLVKGSTYYIYGGSTKLATVTISSIITSVGTTTSSTNPGGNPPTMPGR